VPAVVALNKVDRLREVQGDREAARILQEWASIEPDAIVISARSGEGLDALRRRVRDRVLGPRREVEVELPITASREIDLLEKRAEVLDRDYPEGGRAVRMKVRLARGHAEPLRGVEGALLDGQPAARAIETLWPTASDVETVRVPPHRALHPE